MSLSLNVIIVASQEREIVDICTLACERFVGFERSGRYKKAEILKCFLNSREPGRERKPERAASRILGRISEKVSRAGPGQDFKSENLLVKFGGHWHIVVGENFSTSIEYDQGMIIHIHFGGQFQTNI